MRAVALTTKVPSATATALIIILAEAGIPDMLTTDQGADSTIGAFPRLLDEKGIDHQVTDPRYINGISTLDRAIQELREGLGASERGSSGSMAGEISASR